MPVKGGEPYKEVKAIQAAEKPEAKRAKALTGLRKVEAETKARNEARAAEAKASNEAKAAEAKKRKEALEAAAKPSTDPRIVELLKEFETNKRIVKAGDITNASKEDNLIEARKAILKRRQQLKEPKNKDIYEVLKTKEIMSWKLPPMPKRTGSAEVPA
jgi:hypothetical protein